MAYYYAVKEGHTTGIFDNWAECQKATSGYSGAKYQKFKTKEEAEAYLAGEDPNATKKEFWDDKIQEDLNKGYAVAFCDGSYDDKLKRYAYASVIIDSSNGQHTVFGHSNNSKYMDARNVAGEVMGAIKSMEWAISNGYDKLKIYHDYEGISKWITGDWKAKSNTAQMYYNVYQDSFKDILKVDFEKIEGHTNVYYNELADTLAKNALKNRNTQAVQGENYFSVNNISNDDLESFINKISNEYESIELDKEEKEDKTVFRLKLNKYKITITHYKSKSSKLLVQGKHTLLFQIVVACIAQVKNIDKVETLLRDAYKTSIDSRQTDDAFNRLTSTLEKDVPQSVNILLRQAIINLDYCPKSVEYSQYVFPALKALEGYIKYLIAKAGYTIDKYFNTFDKNPTTKIYEFKPNISDKVLKDRIEACYNWYAQERHSIFHFGDVFQGSTADNTRLIETEQEAKDIIKECIDIICPK